jgi:hypothetical protein
MPVLCAAITDEILIRKITGHKQTYCSQMLNHFHISKVGELLSWFCIKRKISNFKSCNNATMAYEVTITHARVTVAVAHV